MMMMKRLPLLLLLLLLVVVVLCLLPAALACELTDQGCVPDMSQSDFFVRNAALCTAVASSHDKQRAPLDPDTKFFVLDGMVALQRACCYRYTHGEKLQHWRCFPPKSVDPRPPPLPKSESSLPPLMDDKSVPWKRSRLGGTTSEGSVSSGGPDNEPSVSSLPPLPGQVVDEDADAEDKQDPSPPSQELTISVVDDTPETKDLSSPLDITFTFVTFDKTSLKVSMSISAQAPMSTKDLLTAIFEKEYATKQEKQKVGDYVNERMKSYITAEHTLRLLNPPTPKQAKSASNARVYCAIGSKCDIKDGATLVEAQWIKLDALPAAIAEFAASCPPADGGEKSAQPFMFQSQCEKVAEMQQLVAVKPKTKLSDKLAGLVGALDHATVIADAEPSMVICTGATGRPCSLRAEQEENLLTQVPKPLASFKDDGKPLAVFVLGPSAAGKTRTTYTYLSDILKNNGVAQPELKLFRWVDAGELRGHMPLWQQWVAACSFVPSVAGCKDLFKSFPFGKIKKVAVERWTANKDNLVVIETDSGLKSKVVPMIEKLWKLGYKVIMAAVIGSLKHCFLSGTSRATAEGKIYDTKGYHSAVSAIPPAFNKVLQAKKANACTAREYPIAVIRNMWNPEAADTSQLSKPKPKKAKEPKATKKKTKVAPEEEAPLLSSAWEDGAAPTGDFPFEVSLTLWPCEPKSQVELVTRDFGLGNKIDNALRPNREAHVEVADAMVRYKGTVPPYPNTIRIANDKTFNQVVGTPVFAGKHRTLGMAKSGEQLGNGLNLLDSPKQPDVGSSPDKSAWVVPSKKGIGREDADSAPPNSRRVMLGKNVIN